MVDHPRARKMADRIKQIVAEMRDTRSNAPRLGVITLPDTRVPGELQHTTVFYTEHDDNADRAGPPATTEHHRAQTAPLDRRSIATPPTAPVTDLRA